MVGGRAGARRTFELVFAHVDGGGRVGHVGNEVVYHLCAGRGRNEGVSVGGMARMVRGKRFTRRWAVGGFGDELLTGRIVPM